MNVKLGIALLVFPAVCHAGAYTNHSFSYAVELPVGWSARAGDDANPAEFAGPGGILAKLRVIPRPEALTPDLVARLSKGDETKVFQKFTRAKAIHVNAAPLGPTDTSHYGFVYIDGQSTPRVLRFALASQAAPAGYLWLKAQFAYPRLEHAAASPAIDQFLKAFHWVREPAPARPALPAAVAGLSQMGGADVAAALNTYTSATSAADTASAGPPGEVADADSAYYLSLNQKMSEKDTQAHIETFKGGGEHRTEEEMARARSFGMGDILKPNE